MNCSKCKNLNTTRTSDVNFPGGEIIRYECLARKVMGGLRNFPFKNDIICKEEEPLSEKLNFI